MARVTVNRSSIRAELERRQAAAPKPEVPATPAAATPHRWSARVLVVPAALAEAIARLAALGAHGSAGSGPRSSHRQRGIYIWRSAVTANEDGVAADDLLTMPDVGTAENEIAKLKRH